MSDAVTPDPDAESFFATMAGLPTPGLYTQMDRYRDFRQVFMATDQGQRVLREILGWGHMFKSSVIGPAGQPIDPIRMALHEGERNMALRLLTTINTEPVEAPSHVNRTRGKE